MTGFGGGNSTGGNPMQGGSAGIPSGNAASTQGGSGEEFLASPGDEGINFDTFGFSVRTYVDSMFMPELTGAAGGMQDTMNTGSDLAGI